MDTWIILKQLIIIRTPRTTKTTSLLSSIKNKQKTKNNKQTTTTKKKKKIHLLFSVFFIATCRRESIFLLLLSSSSFSFLSRYAILTTLYQLRKARSSRLDSWCWDATWYNLPQHACHSSILCFTEEAANDILLH